MDPLTVALIASMIGKTAMDVGKEKRDRKLAAATQKFSPWTGLRAGEIQEADPFGNVAQFGMAAAGNEQAVQKQAMQEKWLNALQADQMNATKGLEEVPSLDLPENNYYKRRG